MQSLPDSASRLRAMLAACLAVSTPSSGIAALTGVVTSIGIAARSRVAQAQLVQPDDPERELIEQARRAGSAEAYHRYLDAYPFGRHTAEAFGQVIARSLGSEMRLSAAAAPPGRDPPGTRSGEGMAGAPAPAFPSTGDHAGSASQRLFPAPAAGPRGGPALGAGRDLY